MQKPIRYLAVIAVVTVIAAACSSADTLATVNGNGITRNDLYELRPSYQDSASLDAEQVRTDLTNLIILEAVQAAAAEQFGIEITEPEIADRIANPPPRYAAVLADPARSDVTAAAARADATQSLIRDRVVPKLVAAQDGGFETLLGSRPQDVTRVCVRHISTATFEEAQAVLDRIQAGEDFLALVKEVSSDTASPGGLLLNKAGECPVFVTRAGDDFANLAATAPLNQSVGPVSAGGDWHIIRVDERLAPRDVKELAADAMSFLDPDYISVLYTPWLNDAVRAAEIDVSPTMGRWSDTGIGIAPPGE